METTRFSYYIYYESIIGDTGVTWFRVRLGRVNSEAEATQLLLKVSAEFGVEGYISRLL
jgi:cell division protein FtsN